MSVESHVQERQGHVLMERVAVFGRSFNEYLEMFNLEASNWKGKKVLDCASGLSTFVEEANHQGIRAFGCDPAYSLDFKSLMNQGKIDIDDAIKKTLSLPDLFAKPTMDELAAFEKE